MLDARTRGDALAQFPFFVSATLDTASGTAGGVAMHSFLSGHQRAVGASADGPSSVGQVSRLFREEMHTSNVSALLPAVSDVRIAVDLAPLCDSSQSSSGPAAAISPPDSFNAVRVLTASQVQALYRTWMPPLHLDMPSHMVLDMLSCTREALEATCCVYGPVLELILHVDGTGGSQVSEGVYGPAAWSFNASCRHEHGLEYLGFTGGMWSLSGPILHSLELRLVAAQYSLIKGSSSISCGDVVVGETWRRIQRLGVHAYFDRVESKANPVDGLSRGRSEGPWQQVLPAKLPKNLEALLREAATNDNGSMPSE